MRSARREGIALSQERPAGCHVDAGPVELPQGLTDRCVVRERGRPGARVHVAARRRAPFSAIVTVAGLRGVALDKAARVCVGAAPRSTVAPVHSYASKEASYTSARFCARSGRREQEFLARQHAVLGVAYE